jgi:serine/threonine protein kinase
MIPEELPAADRDWATQAFQMEAQMLAKLSHPGLTRVTDFFSEKGNWYLVMDFVPGETLKDRIERYPDKRLPINEALNIIKQLCDVLTYLHTRTPPVIFRDLKPANVMVTPQQEVKLIDFGIARFFKQGKNNDTTNLGTPGYAAPEQYGGAGQSDARTDIYSLGVLINQIITGYDPSTAPSPFPMPDSRSLMPTIPANIAHVISRSTQLQPELRFNNVAELQLALFGPATNQPTQLQTGYGPTQVQYDASRMRPSGTQVMPGASSPPGWSGEPGPPTPYPQNIPQYQTPQGPGYTQIQPSMSAQGTPANMQYTPPGSVTPWPSQTGGPVGYPQTVAAPPAKKKTGLIIAIVGIGMVVIGLCAGAFIFGQSIYDQLFPQPPLTVVETVIDDDSDNGNPVVDPTDTPTVEPTEEPTTDPGDEETPTATQDTTQPTDTPTPTESPSPQVTTSYGSLGTSVQGRDLSFTSYGYDNAVYTVVVVGSIQGDQPLTRDLVDALINFYNQNPGKIPPNSQITLIPSINPDGNALGSRYNAHSVDLNRNWNTSDWKSNAAVPGYPEGKAGAGGSQPFSEPETKALRDYLRLMKAEISNLRILILHSSVRVSNGEIYPGGNDALGISNAYASASGYAIETSWAAYVTSGEAVTWCEEKNIMAIDVVLPASQNPSTKVSGNRSLLDVTADGIRSLLEY